MSHFLRRTAALTRRLAFTVVETLVTVTLIGLMAAFALGGLRSGYSRADAGTDAIRSLMAEASRLAILRQHDVLLSLDTTGTRVRIAEDINNDGIIEFAERRLWHSVSDIIILKSPPTGLTGLADKQIAGTTLDIIDGFPSIEYHRDGTTRSDLRVYIGAPDRMGTIWRALRVTKATGRVERFRYVNSAWASDEK